LNKIVELTPIEPFVFNENGIRFSVKKTQPTWIYFSSPHQKVLSPLWFMFFIESDGELDQVYLKSISLNINEFNIKIKKENVMIPIINIHDKLNNPEYSFTGMVDTNLFETQEIQNDIFPKLTIEELYNKFKKVKEIQFSTTIIYSINGQNKESNIIWNYKSRKITSFAFWDAMMSV
jgi:hypothetical protein